MILEETKRDSNVIIFRCDVSSKDDVKKAGELCTSKFGPVTLLINNAGIVSGKPLLENSDFMIKKTLEVNTLALLYTVREFLPAMYKSNKGHIVTIASFAGHCGAPGIAEYAASKSGAIAIDECIRVEAKSMGKNIKTTCICPFFINTGMFDGAKRIGVAPILD